MEVKINNNGEMVDATIEMVDGVMVVSPKEVKFEPKDGDVVLVTTKDEGKYICFFNEIKDGIVYVHCGLNYLYNMLFTDKQVCRYIYLKSLSIATEEEKKKLFDKLKEEGYEWDADKKELVKLKWKPKKGEPYFSPIFSYVDFLFAVCSHIYTEHFSDELTFKQTSVFKTEQECQEFCNRLNDAINSVKP